MPLSGIRVVDLTRILAGPFCSMMLADMGAEVIKVETPGQGDPLRGQGVIRDGLSWYFAAFNRNKRSLSLNLRTDEGKAVLARLIAAERCAGREFPPRRDGADGLRRSAAEGPEARSRLLPISAASARAAPIATGPSFDFIAQAMSGFMAVTGEADGPPMRAGPPIADLVAGLYGALGVCAALVRRGRTGAGDSVGSSLNNGLISLSAFSPPTISPPARTPARSGNDHAIVSPYGMFRTADGEVAMAPSQEQSYQRLIDALDVPELRDDPRFRTNDLRVANRAAINAAIEARLAGGDDRALDRQAQRRRGAVRPGHGPAAKSSPTRR